MAASWTADSARCRTLKQRMLTRTTMTRQRLQYQGSRRLGLRGLGGGRWRWCCLDRHRGRGWRRGSRQGGHRWSRGGDGQDLDPLADLLPAHGTGPDVEVDGEGEQLATAGAVKRGHVGLGDRWGRPAQSTTPGRSEQAGQAPGGRQQGQLLGAQAVHPEGLLPPLDCGRPCCRAAGYSTVAADAGDLVGVRPSSLQGGICGDYDCAACWDRGRKNVMDRHP
jgi:hypothetical protein